MKRKMSYIVFISTILVLVTSVSCDAVNHLHYSIQNKTNKTVKVHIPSYPIEPNKGEFSAKVDTVIKINPNESLWIGTSPMDIDFPWATKSIYKESPGVCGLELIEHDTVVRQLDCSKSSWKYKKRWSRFNIK